MGQLSCIDWLHFSQTLASTPTIAPQCGQLCTVGICCFIGIKAGTLFHNIDTPTPSPMTPPNKYPKLAVIRENANRKTAIITKKSPKIRPNRKTCLNSSNTLSLYTLVGDYSKKTLALRTFTKGH